MKEYRLGNFVRIVGYIFSAGATVGAYFAVKAGLSATSTAYEILFHLIAILCVGAALFLMREIRISRFVITVDKVYLVSMIYKRTLRLDQIKGWRDVEQEIHIIPNDESLRKIRVSVYFKDAAEIRYFLDSNFPNLDEVEAESQREEILQNEEFGITREARLERLERARKAARYTEWLGWAITAWLFLYPQPYRLSIIAGATYPFFAIGVCYLYRGLILGDGSKNSGYPSVLATIIMVSIMLALRALLDFNTLDYSNGWILMGAVALAIFILYMIPTNGFNRDRKASLVTLFLLPIFTFAYGFGTTTLANGLGDYSEPTAFSTTVVDKRVSSGKSRTYYLKLKKWGTLKEDEEITVTTDEYDQTNIGDTVNVYQFPGMFRMPWVEVN